MMNYLPQIYEDELLYSVIARYRRMCGMVSGEALIKDMFGKFVVVTSTYFPQYIKDFVGNLPPTSKITVEEVINKHTLFPFYSSFLSKQKTDLIYEVMENGANGSRINIEQLIGFGGSKVKKSSYLKYCPICFKEDLEILGESYWRTNHQIIGVLYCSRHQVLLKESSVLSTGSGIEFTCADQHVCAENILEDPYPNRIKELNIEYIKTTERLIHDVYPRKDLDYIIGFYIDKLRGKGLASKNGSLYMNEVQYQFLLYYHEQYLELMQSGIEPESPSNWLRLFVRNNSQNRSPLRHLLFMQFLGIDLEEMFSNKKVVGKVSDPPKHSPSFDINQRRVKWLQLVSENPGANRSQLKEKGKGLHTFIYKYDWEWYDQVTPRLERKREKAAVINWERRDEECLGLANQAVEIILEKEGKPIRVCPSSIRRTVGVGQWFNNTKLVRTNKYLQEVREDIDDFRIRKIKWAIKDRVKQGKRLTVYKVQLHAGFGGSNREVRRLILKVLEECK